MSMNDETAPVEMETKTPVCGDVTWFHVEYTSLTQVARCPFRTADCQHYTVDLLKSMVAQLFESKHQTQVWRREFRQSDL